MKNGAWGWVVILLLCAALVFCGYRVLFQPTVTVTQTPRSEKYFPNPMMGFAPWSNDESIDETDTLVYMDATWAELEPEDDAYAFDAFEKENHCDRWRAEGKQMVFRLTCDYPTSKEHMDIPEWLFDEMGGDGCFYDVKYGKGFSPNYANPVFLSEHAELIAAIGERYGKDEFVYYVELGSIGHWGEWHVNTGQGVDPLPLLNTLSLYGEQYNEAFPSYRLLTRRPFGFAVDKGFGVYNDMAGEVEDTEEFLGWMGNGGAYNDEPNGLSPYPEGWKYAPVGGEINNSEEPETYLGENTERTIQLLKDSHASFIGPGCPNDVPEAYAEDAERVRAAIGYRYRVASCLRTIYGSVGRRQAMQITLTNDGVAPLYETWEVMLYYRDADDNLVYRQHTEIFADDIMPGDEVTINAATDFDNSVGAVRIDLVIEDPRTVRPAVRWAMDENVDGSGYYAQLVETLESQ